MALQKQPIALQFSGGVETKLDAKQVPPTRLLDLQNATFVRSTTLAKRNGYRSVGLGVEAQPAKLLQNLVGIGSRDDETIVFDGARAYSRREEIDAWSDTGEVCSTVVQHHAIARTGTQQSAPDHATTAGVTAVAWEDNRGGVWASLIDADTGRIIVADTQLDVLGQQPRCIAIGSHVCVLYCVPTSFRVYVVLVDPTNVTGMPAPTVVIDNLSSSLPYYDVAMEATNGVNHTGSAAVIAWVLTGGGYEVSYLTEAGQLGSTVAGFPGPAQFPAVAVTGPLAIAFDPITQGSIGVVFATTGNALAVQFSDPTGLSNVSGVTTLLIAGPDAINAITCAYAYSGKIDPQLWWACEFKGPTADTCYVKTGAVSDDLGSTTIQIDGATRILRGHKLASRAFADLNLDPTTPGVGQIGTNVAEIASAYVCVVHPVKFFPYVAVARISGDVWGSRTIVAARLLEGTSSGALPRAMLPSVQPIDPTALAWSRRFAVALGYRIQLGVDASQSSSSNFSEAGIRLVTLDFDADTSYQTAQLGHGLYLPGGLMQHYDGARWAEATFHCAADTATGAAIAPAATSGGAMTDGTYGYVIVYEEIDNQGEIHPGAVSVPVTFALSGSTAVSIPAIPTCRLTSKKNVRISVWRSPANQTGAPNQIPYYRVTGLDPSVTVGNNRYIANDPTVDSVAFVDGFSDAQLLTQEPLYTNGGILSNDPTPCAGGVIATGKNRLFYLDPADPQIVRFTQELREDTGAEESPGLFTRCDPAGGPIIGLSVLDDAVVVHKTTSTMVFGGPGPDADGGQTQNGFTLPQLLTSDAGCSSPRSIVQTPVGVMFASSKGIALLGRDRQMDVSVGSPVYSYKDQTISRATLLPDRRQVVFLTGDADGRTLLYDYEHQQWSTYTNHLGFDACVVNGTYNYLRTDGRVFRETPGQFADDTSHIPMLVSTAWIKLAGYLQGFQRVIHASALGTYQSAHQLKMRYRIDYQAAWSEPILIDMGALYGGSNYGVGNYGDGNYDGDPTPLGTVYQARWHINRRCQSIAFEFSDVEDVATFGASFELSELLLTGGVLGPAFPVGASRSR